MSDLQIYVSAAFILGLLARPLVDQAWAWLRWDLPHVRWFPTRCWQCRRWFRRGNVTRAEHRVAGWVWLCGPCYDDLYRAQGLGRPR